MSDDIDDGFLVSYPVFLLVRKDSITTDEDGNEVLAQPAQYVAMTDVAGAMSLAVFTDEDAARQFAEAQGIDDETVMVGNEHVEALIGTLADAAGSGIKSVLFDPLKAIGVSRRVWDIRHAINELRAGRNLR